MVSRLCYFLEIEPRPQDAATAGTVNASEKEDIVMPAQAKRLLMTAYSEPNKRLARLLGPEFKIWDYTDE